MKSYYSNYAELAAAWVAGNCSSYSYTARKRMNTEHNRIYSYEGGFTVAVKWTAPDTKREWFLITERDYSATTRTHIREVTRAIPNAQAVHLPQVDNLSKLMPDAHLQLVPDRRIDLESPDATEAELASLVLYHEIMRLDEFAGTFLRKRSTWGGFEYAQRRFDQAHESVARFGLTMPARFVSLHDQCAAHYERRLQRNAELENAANSKRYKEEPVQSACQLS